MGDDGYKGAESSKKHSKWLPDPAMMYFIKNHPARDPPEMKKASLICQTYFFSLQPGDGQVGSFGGQTPVVW